MKRTYTTTTDIFNLPAPNAATFDFSNPAHITIAIPTESQWFMPYHWHNSHLDGKRLRCIEGKLQLYVATIQADGRVADYSHFCGSSWQIFDINQHVGWHRSKIASQRHPLKVEYEADQALHRNLCSAILDRDIYPRLSSTPVWIKGLFATVACIPGVKNWLLDRALGVQLEMIYYRHDFHVRHGSIWFQLPWLLLSWGHEEPPLWTEKAYVWSLIVFSGVVMGTTYWFGRLVLGMKGEYAEYSPRVARTAEEKAAVQLRS
ncbi:unnamed protein product [Zymoseptoria tritici ST99CH_3D1]|nr:unnamed protein product [Zymoseptoria tritici ST99CH_3D1]